jgi:hypothetical protein
MRADWSPADMLTQDQNASVVANDLQLWLEEQRNASIVGGEKFMIHANSHGIFHLLTYVHSLFKSQS